MFPHRKKLSPEMQKVYSLSSALSLEDQILFLNLLISTKDHNGKRELIDRALIGERVWEKKKAG